jgi:hypothetical protein
LVLFVTLNHPDDGACVALDCAAVNDPCETTNTVTVKIRSQDVVRCPGLVPPSGDSDVYD